MNTRTLKSKLGEKVDNLAAEPAESKVINMPNVAVVTTEDTALASVASEYTALTTNALEIINENLKNQPLSHQLFD